MSRPKIPEHLSSTPPVARITKQHFQGFTKPKALGTHVLAAKAAQRTPLALPNPKQRAPRHFKSTSLLNPTRKPLNILHPATWPATNSHTSSTSKPYTWPRHGKGTKQTSHNPSRSRRPSTTSLPPAIPSNLSAQPSVCVHTDLSLYPDRHTLLPRHTRYVCACNPRTLRAQRSAANFRWVDGEPLTAYAHAPERAEWCYCSGGEGHVVRTELEAVERFVAGAEARREGRLSERQRKELEGVEWGGTEKALAKQRECPGLRGKVRRWVLSAWWPMGMGNGMRS